MAEAHINNIILNTTHRTWALPTGKWAYYQEWNRVLFLHWKVPARELQALLPNHLELDLYEGNAWISLVPFTMEKIRPNGLPAFTPISNFHEINVRTYVTAEGKPGVYFLNIEAHKYLSAYISRLLSGLPYEKSRMTRGIIKSRQAYSSENQRKAFQLHTIFETGNLVAHKTVLDIWLTERYCLYLGRNKKLYRYQIHHHPWTLQEVKIKDLITSYTIGNISLDTPPDLAHYSEGVQVIAWKREKVTF
ncbi:MAG: DUF2071 domain-containing protein [Niastella sp.]|nr:DUF2071 domain-containing protein [Niastella sp.]